VQEQIQIDFCFPQFPRQVYFQFVKISLDEGERIL
jgi:hypothetical protein